MGFVPDEAANAIIQQWGAFGAVFLLILGPLGGYCWRLQRKLNEVQDQRVADAREVRDTLLAVTKEFSGALQEGVRSSTELKGVYERVVSTLERVEDRLAQLEDTIRDMKPRRP